MGTSGWAAGQAAATHPRQTPLSSLSLRRPARHRHGTCGLGGLRPLRLGPRLGHGAAGGGGGPRDAAEAQEVRPVAVRGAGRRLDEVLAAPQREGAAQPRAQAERGRRAGVPVHGAGVEAAGEVVLGRRRRPAQVLQGEVRGQEAAVGLQLQRQALPEGLQAEALAGAGRAQAPRQHQRPALGAAQPQQRRQHRRQRRQPPPAPHRSAQPFSSLYFTLYGNGYGDVGFCFQVLGGV